MSNILNEEHWYVFYTRSRAEKKIFEFLKKRDGTVYLPLIEEIKQWSDRKKKILTPLFKSYIFIKCKEFNIQTVISNTPGLINVVRYNGKPAFLTDLEIEKIERFINSGLTIELGTVDSFLIGDSVEVEGGPLQGLRGEIIQNKNENYFIVRIEAIQQYLKVQVSPQYLRKIKK